MASDNVISGVIDQAPSEAHLHRALWLIKFLRAMVLHVLLALIAAVLFFGAGIRSVYPIATDLFYAVRAAVIDSEVRGLPLQKSAYYLVLWIVIVAVTRSSHLDLSIDHQPAATGPQVSGAGHYLFWGV
jgi:predicted secreted protein